MPAFVIFGFNLSSQEAEKKILQDENGFEIITLKGSDLKKFSKEEEVVWSKGKSPRLEVFLTGNQHLPNFFKLWQKHKEVIQLNHWVLL